MTVLKCSIPCTSAFNPDRENFYYWDSFEADLSLPELPIHAIYLEIFSHHPWWAKFLLVLRTKIVGVFGLKGPTLAELNSTEIKATYAVGEKIGRFTLFSLTEDEIITGGNDKHLDFRVSVLRKNAEGAHKVILSTVVTPHNFFGKAYLFVILPFHRFGVRKILLNAIAAHRI